MKVKICGITNLQDAVNAVNLGADALGFVFYKPSPRDIEPLTAKKIIAKIPPFIERVGLFVNCSSEFVNQTCKEAKISLAQIHFEANEEFYEDLKVKHIKVVRAKNREDLKKFADEYRIVDAFVESFGGAGVRINIDWFDGIDKSKIILAGGLNPQNLDEIKNLGFYGVDVSSGVEKSKGFKDYNKMKKFIERAKNA